MQQIKLEETKTKKVKRREQSRRNQKIATKALRSGRPPDRIKTPVNFQQQKTSRNDPMISCIQNDNLYSNQ